MPLTHQLSGAQTGSRVYTSILCCSVLLCPLSSALSLLSSSSLLPLGWFLPLHSNALTVVPQHLREWEQLAALWEFLGWGPCIQSQVPGPQTVGGWRQEYSLFLDTPWPCQEHCSQERGRHWERCFWPGTWRGCVRCPWQFVTA